MNNIYQKRVSRKFVEQLAVKANKDLKTEIRNGLEAVSCEDCYHVYILTFRYNREQKITVRGLLKAIKQGTISNATIEAPSYQEFKAKGVDELNRIRINLQKQPPVHSYLGVHSKHKHEIESYLPKAYKRIIAFHLKLYKKDYEYITERTYHQAITGSRIKDLLLYTGFNGFNQYCEDCEEKAETIVDMRVTELIHEFNNKHGYVDCYCDYLGYKPNDADTWATKRMMEDSFIGKNLGNKQYKELTRSEQMQYMNKLVKFLGSTLVKNTVTDKIA